MTVIELITALQDIVHRGGGADRECVVRADYVPLGSVCDTLTEVALTRDFREGADPEGRMVVSLFPKDGNWGD